MWKRRALIIEITGTSPVMTSVGASISSEHALRACSVQAFAHFLSGLEKRYALVTDCHMRSSPRVSSRMRWPVLHGKRAETTQLDPIAAGECRGDLAENRVDEFLDVTLVEVRVLHDDALNELRLDHLVMPLASK
jgi:hypothetical protein